MIYRLRAPVQSRRALPRNMQRDPRRTCEAARRRWGRVATRFARSARSRRSPKIIWVSSPDIYISAFCQNRSYIASNIIVIDTCMRVDYRLGYRVIATQRIRRRGRGRVVSFFLAVRRDRRHGERRGFMGSRFGASQPVYRDASTAPREGAAERDSRREDADPARFHPQTDNRPGTIGTRFKPWRPRVRRGRLAPANGGQEPHRECEEAIATFGVPLELYAPYGRPALGRRLHRLLAGMPELGVAVWLVNIINGVFSSGRSIARAKRPRP